jgi:CheY-like chemotaxis protein
MVKVSPKILIVDDDKDDQEFVSMAIKLLAPGAELFFADDGIHAIELLVTKGLRPDLILLDLNMGVNDGRSTLKVIKRDSELKAIPVFILTTSKQPYEKAELLKLGAADFYSKPNSPEEYKTILNSIFSKVFP